MQSLDIGKQEPSLKIKIPLIQPQLFSNSSNNISPYKEEIKQKNDFLKKKIKNDAELISWLSGKDIDSKKYEDRHVPEELNSKVKKKLKNKLIKNAKNCELYFIKNFSDKKFITVSCIYCLKNFFDHNELLKFANFEELVYYLKYIFYLSDKVFAYSSLNFKNNKKDSDNLFSRFKSREENWNFKGHKYLCKLCILKLVNKPNLIENMKNIFLNGKNEANQYNKKNMFLMENFDEINDEIKSKEENNKIYELKAPNFKKNNENEIPKEVNIFNSSNYIKENAKIKNNGLSYMEIFNNLDKKIKNNQHLTPEEENLYLKINFFIIQNKILETCDELKNKILFLYNYICATAFQTSDIKRKNDNKIIIKDSQDKTLSLFNQLVDFIIMTKISLNAYKAELGNKNINLSLILDELINQNTYHFYFIESIVFIYITAVNTFISE